MGIKKNINKVFAKFESVTQSFKQSNNPSFMIIGAQKCGTSSMHFYLDQHPMLAGAKPKEVGYFHRDAYFGLEIKDYKKHFRGSGNKIYSESTPEYLYHPDVAQSIASVYPNLKFIVILREPVSRAYSAWNHYKNHFDSGRYKTSILNISRRSGNELGKRLFENRTVFPSFRECIEMELEMMASNSGFEPGIIRRGLYLQQLLEFRKYFEPTKFLIVGFRDFVDDLEGTLLQATNFLEVESLDFRQLDTESKNTREYSEKIRDEDKTFLEKIYEEPNQLLFNDVGVLNW